MSGEVVVRVRCFAMLRELATSETTLSLPAGSTLAAAWTALAASYPAIGDHRPYVRAARNSAYAAWETAVADGDEVAFLPPVSGGSSSGLTDASIDVAALEEGVAGPGHGAVVTFVGRARDRSDDGRTVVELAYEAYAEMAEAVLAEIATEAEHRWPGVSVAVVHRLGVVPTGEVAVAIVVAGVHRSAAYEANRHVIEAIKERLPIWKLERFTDGSEWKRTGA